MAFWSALLGPPQYTEPGAGQLAGFRVGDTWLTLFPSSGGPHPDSAPRGCEFALRVAAAADVDRMHAQLVAHGAVSRMAPRDTWMYERMRYACVDDPFGVRVDVYCPLPSAATPVPPRESGT